MFESFRAKVEPSLYFGTKFLQRNYFDSWLKFKCISKKKPTALGSLLFLRKKKGKVISVFFFRTLVSIRIPLILFFLPISLAYTLTLYLDGLILSFSTFSLSPTGTCI